MCPDPQPVRSTALTTSAVIAPSVLIAARHEMDAGDVQRTHELDLPPDMQRGERATRDGTNLGLFCDLRGSDGGDGTVTTVVSGMSRQPIVLSLGRNEARDCHLDDKDDRDDN